MASVTSSEGPPQRPDSHPVGRRWPVWVFLAMVASPVVFLFMPDRPPPPPPPLPPGWTRFTTDRDGLSVDLPAEPTKHGPVEMLDRGSNTSWVCVVDGYTFVVRRMGGGHYPPEVEQKPDDMLNGFCDGLKQTLEPEASSWRVVSVGGRPVRELQYRGPKAANVTRFVQVDRTLYFFMVGAPGPEAALDGPDVTHFLDSVRFGR